MKPNETMFDVFHGLLYTLAYFYKYSGNLTLRYRDAKNEWVGQEVYSGGIVASVCSECWVTTANRRWRLTLVSYRVLSKQNMAPRIASRAGLPPEKSTRGGFGPP